MHPFFEQDSVFCDAIFHDMARMLTENRDRPSFRRELLQPSRLDMSPNSLHHLDDYVHSLHADAVAADDRTRVSLRLGAYVGEVIRYHCTDVEYHWIDYKDAATRSEAVRAAGMTVQVTAVLWAPRENIMCFPIAKACKFLEDPLDEGLYAYARLAMARQQVDSFLSPELEVDTERRAR